MAHCWAAGSLYPGGFVELLTIPLVAPGAEMSRLRHGEPAFRLVCGVRLPCLGEGAGRVGRILREETISSADWPCVESRVPCGEVGDSFRWNATHDIGVAAPG